MGQIWRYDILTRWHLADLRYKEPFCLVLLLVWMVLFPQQWTRTYMHTSHGANYFQSWHGINRDSLFSTGVRWIKWERLIWVVCWCHTVASQTSIGLRSHPDGCGMTDDQSSSARAWLCTLECVIFGFRGTVEKVLTPYRQIKMGNNYNRNCNFHHFSALH